MTLGVGSGDGVWRSHAFRLQICTHIFLHSNSLASSNVIYEATEFWTSVSNTLRSPWTDPSSRMNPSSTTLMSLAHIFTHYFTGLVVVILAHRVWHRHVSLRRLPLPPGPKPLPLLGNLLDLPRKLEWLTYRAWNEQYGDVVYVEALGQKIVILGTADAVSDLMERRGSIYSHRAGSEMISELCVVFLFLIQIHY
jgi:hypothetical protein